MRILVNAVAAKMGGALRHLKNFLRTLEETDHQREYWVYIDPGLDVTTTAPNVHIHQAAQAGKSLLHRLRWDQVVIPQLLKEHKIDTVLSILNFGPVKPLVRQIIFQRNPIYFSDYYMSTVAGMEKVETRLRRWLAYKTMQASEVVVTPSMAMRDMILSVYPQLRPEMFRVIYHGFDGELFSNNSQPLPTQAERLLDAHGNGGVKLLYATHAAKHKGFHIAFQALKHIRDAGVNAKLFLTTDLSDWPKGARMCGELISSLGVEHEVVFLGRIPQESMAGVYKACDLFFFPSLCESFGFTMLEAMNAGLPVVAADTPINREICSDAAIYYDGHDARQAAAQIQRVLEERDLATRLAHASLARVRGFDWSWKREVSEVLNLLE